MKFLIPTAKEMADPGSIPAQQLSEQSQAILAAVSCLSADQLTTFYKISPAAAQKEWQRWQDLLAGTASSYPAIQLFNGLMYRQMDRTSDYLNQHVLITSSFYGVIPADWPIVAHRLDFQQKLVVDGQALKTYWRPYYDQAVQGEELLISLLSSEFEEVFSPAVREQFITVSFQEEKAGQLKTHSTISKKGRGLFLNQASLTGARTLDHLRQLTFAGFAYRPDLSTDQHLAYVRQVDNLAKKA